MEGQVQELDTEMAALLVSGMSETTSEGVEAVCFESLIKKNMILS
jgi:hypothetical protein